MTSQPDFHNRQIQIHKNSHVVECRENTYAHYVVTLWAAA